MSSDLLTNVIRIVSENGFDAPIDRMVFLSRMMNRLSPDAIEIMVKHCSGTSKCERALNLAAYFGNLPVVQALIKRGTNPNAGYPDLYFSNPLSEAIKSGHFDVVRFLVENGADVNAAYEGRTPLSIACLNVRLYPDQVRCIRLLLENGADVHAFDEAAIRCASIDIIRILIGYGANIHIWNEYLLWKAAFTGNDEAVRFFIENGADVHARDGYRASAATQEELEEIATTFLYWCGDDDYFDFIEQLDSDQFSLEVSSMPNVQKVLRDISIT